MTAPRYQSPSGLRVEINRNGSLRRMDHGDIILNLFPGNELEGGPTNIYLRRHGAAGIEAVALLGPRSPGTIHLDERGLRIDGVWQQLRFAVALVLAESAAVWLWQVTIENVAASAAVVDLIYAQDVALANYGTVRMNEYYVSQYVDHTPLEHPQCGTVLAVRQNLPMGGHNPWVVLGSLRRGVSFATDALQLWGLAARRDAAPQALGAAKLPGCRQQHEHSMAVIQDDALTLAPGTGARGGFFGWFEADHPAASSNADLVFVDRVLALPETNAAFPATTAAAEPAAPALFSAAPMLSTFELNDDEIDKLFGKRRRNVEREDGRLLSFFTGAQRHVVLRAKELEALRPHGHILRSGDHLIPDEASMTSTTWMDGVFHSQVTQGHVGINCLLSTTRSYLGLQRCAGQRVFVELGGKWVLLGLPSAYEMGPNGCRWLYKHDGGWLQVRSWAPIDRHELNLSAEIVEGEPCRFLVSHHVALNGDDGAEAVPVDFVRRRRGVVVRAIADSNVGRRFPAGFFRIDAGRGTVFESVGGDELLFIDGQSRRQPFLTLLAAPTKTLRLRITGHLVADSNAKARLAAPRPYATDARRADGFWKEAIALPRLSAGRKKAVAARVEPLQEILPWLAHNALIHYLAPRGPEQYSGGGWGTRDVSQGPVRLLQTLGRWEAWRDLLGRLFKTQNPDGDWPQWFMFFERERGIRPPDSHGDIVFWPLVALGQYLNACEDASILDEVLPFFHPDGDAVAEQATLWGHVERALQLIAARVIPGTHLAAYGHGDWNDSLQPVDAAMAQRMCSAWTVTLHHQALATLAAALRRCGQQGRAVELEAQAGQVAADFHRLLIPGGTVAGYAHFDPAGSIDYWLHPSDQLTGIHYSLLPMMHGILHDLFSPEQARAHIACIRAHLLAVDGARLFDRPFPYHGGPQRIFQRAESSTFFGREIGIMYMHAHLWYAEAMAHYGDADAFYLAVQQANPIGLCELVPAARRRQVNCYYSSSDAFVGDRYEALARYDAIRSGAVPLEGGWRVYSSGAGLALRLIQECLLGIRRGTTVLGIDPAVPKSLNGLRAALDLAGRQVSVEYAVAKLGTGPTRLRLNGADLPFERRPNPYRLGGVEVAMDTLRDRLGAGVNRLQVSLS